MTALCVKDPTVCKSFSAATVGPSPDGPSLYETAWTSQPAHRCMSRYRTTTAFSSPGGQTMAASFNSAEYSLSGQS